MIKFPAEGCGSIDATSLRGMEIDVSIAASDLRQVNLVWITCDPVAKVERWGGKILSAAVSAVIPVKAEGRPSRQACDWSESRSDHANIHCFGEN